MQFKSKWITTPDFAELPVRNVFCKENSKQDFSHSAITNYHVHFRKRFFVEETENVFISISADDYCKLYVNGKFVCQGPAAGYPSNYKYIRADISPYLKRGENVIAVHVYYQGLINRVWVSGDNRMGLIADVYQKDKFLFGTDKSWKYSVAREFGGELVGYETSFLENIDFTLCENGWKELSFDDGAYLPSCEKDGDYTFYDEPVPPVEVYRVKPERVVKLGDGKYFIDFGGEITGSFYMEATGERGQRVNILCGEETLSDDPLLVRHDMRCNCDYNEVCTLSGGRDELEFFDYKAFRYVNVFTETDNLEPETFAATVSHYRFDKKLRLKTDIPNLQRIWDMCERTVRFGAQESLCDCPTREKGVYLADFLVGGIARMHLTDDAEMCKRALFDFAETARVCPGMMAIASCSMMQEIADYSLLYPLLLLHYYKITKDIKTLRSLYPTVCGILKYFKQFERADGLLENVHEKWNMVDWPQNLNDGYDAYIKRDTYGIDCHNVINAYYIGAIKTANEIAAILGAEERLRYEEKERAYENAFFDEKRGLYCDSGKKTHSALHSNVLPLLFGIAKGETQSSIKSFIMEKGLSCGVWFAYFVLKALAKVGAYEEVLTLLTNESEHSWVNMLREGATTCFEAWGREQKWNTSLCHPWACAPILIITEDLDGRFGIKVEKIKSKDSEEVKL